MDDLTNNMAKTMTPDQTPGNRKWLARFGLAAFIFFFVKGLVWLALGAGAWAMIRND